MTVIDLIIERVNKLNNFIFDSRRIQKGIGEHIQILCYEQISGLNDEGLIVIDTLSTKSIEDVEIKYEDNLYKIDIKPHDISKDFSIPNLISIDKARKYLKKTTNHIIYIFIDYKVVDDMVTITNILVKPIESLDWSYLAVQNIGKGQLQLKSTTSGLFFNDNVTRKEWMDKLIKEGKEYYDRLILKVSEYISNWNDDTKWD